LIYLYLIIASAAIGALIGHSRREAGLGFLFGVMLGPLGWIMTAVMAGKE
jgi:hypothetical protein